MENRCGKGKYLRLIEGKNGKYILKKRKIIEANYEAKTRTNTSQKSDS